jgi:protein-histidine pros-kinase
VHGTGAGPYAALDAWLHLTKAALRFEPVSCRTVVRQVANALRPMAKRMGLQFETRLPRRDLVVRTDRRALTDILLSLANHAIGLTDRGKIRLEAGARRDDHGRRFSEIRVVGGTVDGTNVSEVQAVGQGDALAATGTGACGVVVHRSDQLARRLGGRISVDYELGRQSAFALMLPNVPPRQKPRVRLPIWKDT